MDAWRSGIQEMYIHVYLSFKNHTDLDVDTGESHEKATVHRGCINRKLVRICHEVEFLDSTPCIVKDA